MTQSEALLSIRAATKVNYRIPRRPLRKKVFFVLPLPNKLHSPQLGMSALIRISNSVIPILISYRNTKSFLFLNCSNNSNNKKHKKNEKSSSKDG